MYLFSIKPKYVKKIKDRTKRYEFRKYISEEAIKKIKNKHIAIYESYPTKAITILLKVGIIDKKTVNNLWRNYKKYSGISKKAFDKYFDNKKLGLAIEIKKVIAIKEPIARKDIEEIHPAFVSPQNYRELEDKFGKLNTILHKLTK